MSEDSTGIRNDRPPQSNSPISSETSAGKSGPIAEEPAPSRALPVSRLERFQAFTSKLGGTSLFLLVLVALVAGGLYLSERQVLVNDSNRPKLIIVQLNDIYRLDAVRAGKRGGLARVVTLLRDLKRQNPETPIIVVHAGDFLSPSLESNLFHGAQMVDAMNFIHEVASLYVVPGNHEFDYSDADKGYLTDAILKSKFTWLASNLERSDSSLLPALRDRINQRVLVRFGDVKIGFFGLTIDKSHEGKNQPYAPLSGDYARIASDQIQQLEREGADLIIGLTHLNIGDDHELAKLKQAHPQFLWIAGGHEHTLDRVPQSEASALITKGDSNARSVWKLTVLKNGPKLEIREESIAIDESIRPDPGFTKDIESFYAAKLRYERPYLDAVISTHPNRCYDGTEEAVRDRESDWGDLLTDTMRGAFKGMTADVAVLNGGSIRIDDTICERTTFEDLERTFAYETPVVFVKLKGKDLKESILESSASSKRGDGRFLQVSGVTFRRDSSASGSVMRDLQLVSTKSSMPFDESKTYVVAVSKYLFDCGDGYKFRRLVTDYIPSGPDLRALTFAALSAQIKGAQPAGRIIDLPSYVRLPALPPPKWQTLSAADRTCR